MRVKETKSVKPVKTAKVKSIDLLDSSMQRDSGYEEKYISSHLLVSY